MARHHIVPQLLLRNFADADERIVMVDRGDLGHVVPTKVKTAGAETGFYRIPAEDLGEHAQAGHDPEVAERALGGIETAADPVIKGVLDGTLTIGDHERYRLSQFTAFQLARGWRFREVIQAYATAHVRDELRAGVTPDHVREHLRSMGKPTGDQHVREFLGRALNGSWTVRLPKSELIQAALRYAVEVVLPLLYSRPLHLISFGEPQLLTSDAAVGLWDPEAPEPRSAGVPDARAVFLPLDRWHALAFMRDVLTVDLNGTPLLADNINFAVAGNAVKWIYHHPDDHPLSRIELPPPLTLVEGTG